MPHNPHDALFKWTFGQPDRAASVLRSILPRSVSDAIDWKSLVPDPASFVDAALVDRHSDLLFRVCLRDGRNAHLYVLFEHQSTPDELMPFRLFSYLVRIWERWLATTPGA